METNKDQSNENEQKLFIQSLLSQGTQVPPFGLAQIQSQAGEWKNFIVKKMWDSGVPLLKAVGTEKLVAGNLEAGHPL